MEATWNPAKQCRDSGDASIYQPFVKIWLGDGASFRGDAQHRTRNLEIPGSLVSLAPRNDE
jgi:hypothetical protein